MNLNDLKSLARNLYVYIYFTEPNNESPLNVKAAQMWPRQEVFKATLLSTYKESESN